MTLTSSASDKSLSVIQQDPYPVTPPVVHPHVGFVGLGAMGYPMAKNLAVHHHAHPGGGPILVWNRSRDRAVKLHAELPNKVRIADSLEQIVDECDVIFTSIGSDEAVKEVYNIFYNTLKNSKHHAPKIFAETSTIFPTLASELDSLLSQVPHTHFVACPVFGPPTTAQKAELILVVSGDYRSKKTVAYVAVPAFGRKVIDLGGNIEKAHTFKLLGNSMILGCIEIMGEAMTLADKSGCGADHLFDFIKEFLPAAPFLNYGPKMLEDNFDGSTGFAIEGGIKDSTHIRRLMTAHNSPMPIVDIAHSNLLTARAIHSKQQALGTAKYDVLDWSALVAGSRLAAGLPGLNSKERPSKVVRDD